MSEDEIPDPDRAAILARRRRFIALAISGLAAGACRPQACLSISVPEEGGEGEGQGEGEGEPNASGPFVEDPGVPVEGGETGGEATEGETGEVEGVPHEPKPQVCLKVAPTPQPCLRKRPSPHPCLMIIKNGET